VPSGLCMPRNEVFVQEEHISNMQTLSYLLIYVLEVALNIPKFSSKPLLTFAQLCRAYRAMRDVTMHGCVARRITACTNSRVYRCK
jgi:hypothetical protein